MTKSEIRTTYKALRNNLSEEEIEDLSLQIANQLLQMDIWNFGFYHIFLTIQEHKEVNTDYILSILSGKDKNIVISKSDFSKRDMSNFLLTDSTKIEKNKWNIPEPVDGISIEVDQIDVIFVPLLAFDNFGHRVGYGKGFYDKFLEQCRPETIKIGLSFFESLNKIDDTFENDVPLDFCVTPEKIYKF